MTYKPCGCEEPGRFSGVGPGVTVLMRGDAFRDPKRKELGLPDLHADGGGILDGTFWGKQQE